MATGLDRIDHIADVCFSWLRERIGLYYFDSIIY